MDGNENYGLILKLVRQKSDLSVRELARRVGKSIGWISEVENASGLARLSEDEFNRLVGALDADAVYSSVLRECTKTGDRGEAA